jgi:hypothetical protein
MSNNPGNFGASLYGLDPYGSTFAPFGVAGATSYGPHFVQVRFTDLIDLSDAAFTTPGNYVISPPLAVNAVVIESADSVVLQTNAQSFVSYTVTVGAARSYFEVPMYPPRNTATFTGFPSIPAYFSCATTATRVRSLFSTPMMPGPLTNVANYTVTDLNDNVLPVVSVQIEQVTGPALSVVLTLGTPMVTSSWYQTLLNPAIVNTDDEAPEPSDFDFQFILPVQMTSVPISEFTGEVSNEMFGNPDGLVYFSPSLNVAASNSIIQVEEVDVCSIAYDTYTPPPVFDPAPFYTWSPSGPQTFLLQPGIVLFAGFPRMSEAMFELEFTPTHLMDTVPPPFDNSVCITMAQQFATGYVALLNDPAFWLFDGTHSATPPMWICADNLAPIPPGPETIIVLFLGIYGDSTMTVAAPNVVHWAIAHIEADSFLATIPEIAPLTMAANSYMRVKRPSLNLGATCSIVADSSLQIAGLPAPQNYSVTASIVGYATVEARCEQHWLATAHPRGVSSIFVRAGLNQPISAALVAGSSSTSHATVGPVANAALVAGSAMTAHGTLHHFATASLSGGSSMTAVAT